ncbi:MAG: hypothetical protein IBX63_05390 [Coriobacteriia bacterium]|nr:hypothetical protein [Coriobacteriia bacterium]
MLLALSPALSARPRAVSVAVLDVALALVTALALPVVAAASPLGAINMVLMYESPYTDTPLLGVTARLADDISLPAEIVLPVPEGANVMWSGEYFVGATEGNILVQARQETRDGVPVIAFPLSQSRFGHAEVTYPSSLGSINSSTGAREVGFELTLPVDTGPVYAAIALPPNVTPVEGSDIVQMSREPDGFTYYSIERPSAAAGDSISLSLVVIPADPPEMYNETVPWILAVVAAVIVGAALWLLASRKQRTTEGST